VPAVRLRQPAALLLHRLFHHPAGSPRAARQRHVPRAVRQRLGRVLREGAEPHHPGSLLMTRAALAAPAVRRVHLAVTAKENVIIALIMLFTSVAWTLEAYWLMFHQIMESRTDLFARTLALYWPADYTYRIPGYPIEKSFTLAVESVNTLVTPLLS